MCFYVNASTVVSVGSVRIQS